MLNSLASDVARLRKQDPELSFWLIGSFATNKWDAYSDVDVVCVSPLGQKYRGADFLISRQYSIDVFSMDRFEFAERMTEGGLFADAIHAGVKF